MSVIWVISSVYAKADRLKALHQALFPVLSKQDQLVYSGNYFGYHPYLAETFEALSTPPCASPVFLKGHVEKTLATFEHLHLQHKPEDWLQTLDLELYEPILDFYGFSFDFLMDIALKGAVSLARFSEDFRTALRTAGHASFFHNLKKNASIPVLESLPSTPAGLQKRIEGFTLSSGPLLSDPLYAISVDPKTGMALEMIEV